MYRRLYAATIAASLMFLPQAAEATSPNDTQKKLYHVVKYGETLSGLAKRYGCALEELQKINVIEGERIVEGMRLIVPWPDLRLRTAREIYVSRHKVIPGESLGTIARRYDSDVRSIMLFNRMRADKIKIGEIIAVPSAAPAQKRVKATYVVQAGDTLRAIAEKHGLPTRQVRFLNPGRDWHYLRVGDKITVFEWRQIGVAKPKPTAKAKGQEQPPLTAATAAPAPRPAPKPQPVAVPAPAASCNCPCAVTPQVEQEKGDFDYEE